jgi:uncharacterized protein
LQSSGAMAVTVEGWASPAWLPASSHGVPISDCQSLLIGPFDNLIWDRERLARAFGFKYVFEAYKPVAKRKHGYYVFAVLDAGDFIGRADLRRDGGALQIVSAHAEEHVSLKRFNDALNRAFDRLRTQLRLG